MHSDVSFSRALSHIYIIVITSAIFTLHSGWFQNASKKSPLLKAIHEVWLNAQFLNYSDSVVSNLFDMAREVSMKRLHVGFIGIMKAGKSTTLNALLQRDILPSSLQAETALEVVIKHDPDSPNGLLLGEKNSTNELTFIAEGKKEDIRNSILWLNKERRDQGWSKFSRLILNVSIPFLSKGANDVALTISDTPGSDEAVSMDLDLDKSIQHLAAFVIVLDYRKMKSEAEILLLKDLYKHHATILNTPERLLFIINHMNVYHEHKALRDENSLPPQDAPSFVSKYLEQLLNIKVSADQVIPYSAFWALHGRLCLSNPDHMDKRLLEEAEVVLSGSHNNHSDHGDNTTCKKLEEYSKILLIEERMLDRFVQYGHKVIERNAAEKTVEILCNVLDEIDQMRMSFNMTTVDLEGSVKLQKRKFEVVDHILSNISGMVAEPMDEIYSSVAPAISIESEQKMAIMIDKSSDDTEALVFNSKDELKSTLIKSATNVAQKGSDLVNTLISNGLIMYVKTSKDMIQRAVSKIQKELEPLMGKEAQTYGFISTTLSNAKLLTHLCDTASIVYIHNYTELYIKQHSRIRALKMEREFSMWLINPDYYTRCGYEVKEVSDDFYTVKALPLNRKLVQYIQSCYSEGEKILTMMMKNISRSVSKEFYDHIQLWWNERVHTHREKLIDTESKLQDAKQQLLKLKEKELTLLEQYESLKSVLARDIKPCSRPAGGH